MIMTRNQVETVDAVLRELRYSADPSARRAASSLRNQLGRVKNGGEFNEVFYKVLDLYEDVRRAK